MPRSGHVAGLRRMVGNHLLVLPAVMLCVVDQANRLLVVQHDDGGVWAPPGGAVEPGEGLAAAQPNSGPAGRETR